MYILSYIGVFVVGFVFYNFLRRLGKELPILELVLFVAGLQWIVGAFIAYRIKIAHYKYYMYVDETTYMNFVVPAYIIFSVITLYFTKIKRIKVASIEYLSEYSKLAVILFGIGFIFDLIETLPEQLGFVLYFVRSLKFVGAIALFFSPIKWHRYFLYFALFLLIGQALNSGMFHEFLLWSMFFYMFWALKKATSAKFNLVILLIGFIFGTTIQAVKSDFRAFVWNGFSGNKLGLFINILNNKLSTELADNSDEQQNLNVRLNQGWIISAIMYNVPKREEHAYGRTIFESLEAAAIPRFLNPEKKKAGGVENFKKYTGLPLAKNTSMGISIIGEAYANFGVYGGILFMGVWALFLGCVWVFLIDKVNFNPKWLFVLPLVFIQVVKAETEFSVVLNHLVKSIIFIFILFHFTSVLMKLRIPDESKD